MSVLKSKSFTVPHCLPPGVILGNLPKATKELRVNQTLMSIFCQLDLTLIEYDIKKIVITAHLGSKSSKMGACKGVF